MCCCCSLSRHWTKLLSRQSHCVWSQRGRHWRQSTNSEKPPCSLGFPSLRPAWQRHHPKRNEYLPTSVNQLHWQIAVLCQTSCTSAEVCVDLCKAYIQCFMLFASCHHIFMPGCCLRASCSYDCSGPGGQASDCKHPYGRSVGTCYTHTKISKCAVTSHVTQLQLLHKLRSSINPGQTLPVSQTCNA